MENLDDSAGPISLLSILHSFEYAPFEIGSYLLVLTVLIFFSGLVSGSEVAFFSLDGDDIFNLQKSKKRRSKLVVQLLTEPKRLLASILIANNLINVAIVTISTLLTWELTGNVEISFLSSAIVTVIIVFFGEVLPKIYANSMNVSFARRTAIINLGFNKIFWPFAAVLLKISSIIEHRIEQKGYDVSVDDLSEVLAMTTEESSEEEKDILKGVVKFGTIHVKQIMRSRLDITAIDYQDDFHHLMDKINKCGYSRIPVFKGSIDNIVGVLYIKDILPYIEKAETYRWQNLLRSTYFIPENKKIDDLLRSFQSKRVHMAIVTDEYAGTSGLITLEDVIEEIVGEINDEFDHDEIDYNKIDEQTFSFEAKTSLNDLTKILDINDNTFDEVKGESESIAGLLLELQSGIPNAGEIIDYEQFTFTIESVNKKRIKRVKIYIKQKDKV